MSVVELHIQRVRFYKLEFARLFNEGEEAADAEDGPAAGTVADDPAGGL